MKKFALALLLLLASAPSLAQLAVFNSRAVGAYTLGSFAPTTSAQLRGVLTDETGSGAAVFGTSPTIATPALTGAVVVTGSISFGASDGFDGTLATTATPGAQSIKLEASGGSQSGILFRTRNGSGTADRVTIDKDGNVAILTGTLAVPKTLASGTAPTMGACGTSPSVAGKDEAMLVTVGTGGAATSCAVTFGAEYTNAPVCHAQNDTDRVAYSIVTTTTTVTISAAAAFTASSKFHVLCRSYS